MADLETSHATLDHTGLTGVGASGPVTSSGLTMATARLLGRTTASTGAVEEITVGSGLSLSAGALTASGSSYVAGKVERTNIGSNLTIASATWAYVDTTNLAITMTTGAHRVLLSLSGYASCDAASKIFLFGWDIDGTAKYDDNMHLYHTDAVAGEAFQVMHTWVTDALTAASHTFKPRWARLSAAGTLTLYQSAASDRIVFSAVELGA